MLQFSYDDPDYVGATQRMFLDLTALVSSWAYVSRSHWTIIIRDSSWLSNNTRALHTQQTETHTSISLNEVYLIVQELQSEGQSNVTHIYGPT